MTRVGIVGGLGPESTIDYYRRLLEGWAQRNPSTAPDIVIDSLDVRRAMHFIEYDRAGLTEYLSASLLRLAGAGADFIVISANTPHLVFDELVPRSPVPLLSIVEVCAAEATRRGLTRLLLLGTRFTMESTLYSSVCTRHGIEVLVPEAADREWVHARYVNELLPGNFRDETRGEFVALIDRMRGSHDIDGVILGGTELPLLLRSAGPELPPMLDTTALHVSAILDRLQAGAPD